MRMHSYNANVYNAQCVHTMRKTYNAYIQCARHTTRTYNAQDIQCVMCKMRLRTIQMCTMHMRTSIRVQSSHMRTIKSVHAYASVCAMRLRPNVQCVCVCVQWAIFPDFLARRWAILAWVARSNPCRRRTTRRSATESNLRGPMLWPLSIFGEKYASFGKKT
jgi:hypothetical protein